ncbi:MAG: SMC family ATPase, partial [Acidobacteriota bacterium]|nr:SMC family ATPase [Acidobacteriota bacterium]
MHITRIELENIKSFESAAFEFGRGTTAIMGENGAGKTSLIEAVAWTLFDLIDYKKDDFLKRGTKRGLVRVEFESGLDERRYIVQRDTRTAYFVYDPRLKTRIADKKEEVTRFLWQHLGVEPGTDLESLFRRAIGVPQGTFTAIFLETPNERKKAFDKLLKVEEYRIGAMRLGRTAKHIDSESLEIIQRIARAEGELGNRDKLKKDRKSFSALEKDFLGSLKKITKEVARQNKSVAKLEKTKTEFETLKSGFEKIRQEQERTEIVSAQSRNEVRAAEKAAAVVKETADAHAKHKKAIGMLSELERERKEREKLRTALTEIEKAILSVKAEQKSVQSQLDEIESKRKAVSELEPLVEKQDRLEGEKKKLEESVSKNREKAERVESLEGRLKELRERHKSNKSEIAAVEGFKVLAGDAEKHRLRDEQITNELAALRARIERDQEFQVQIEGGLCPVFSEKCLNLKPGQTLEGFLSDKFSGLKAKVATL